MPKSYFAHLFGIGVNHYQFESV